MPLREHDVAENRAPRRWRRFRRQVLLSARRRPSLRSADLTWRDLLDRKGTLIVSIRAGGLGDRDEVAAAALIDTTGAARFAATIQPDALAWPTL
ncbi:MAG: hypothetical protein OXG74_08305, partial [Acidobacteria bacterium]|nr:hypothetical protein [Acidobacteriota bacterium]